MALLALAIALLLERYYHNNNKANRDKISNSNWFISYQNKVSSSLKDQSWFKGWLREAILILVPTLFVYLLFQWALSDGWQHTNFINSVVMLALAVLVLVHCLGPESPRKSLQKYYGARASHDDQGAFESAKLFTGYEDANSISEIDVQVARSIFRHTQTRYFAVIIWFLLLGPAGAVLYRLSNWYMEQNQAANFAKNLSAVLEWVPARVSALMFLLAGDMSSGTSKIKKSFLDFEVQGLDLVMDAGQASLGFYEAEDVRGQSRCALKLTERAGILLFALVAIFSLLGWGIH